MRIKDLLFGTNVNPVTTDVGLLVLRVWTGLALALATLRGRAIVVIRLARLTGRPYQSPPRLSAGPVATPARSDGNPSPSASAASSASTARSRGRLIRRRLGR